MPAHNAALQAGGDHLLHHLAAGDGGKIIARLPARRIGLEPGIHQPALEGLELRVAIPEIVEPHLVEIVQPALHRQVGGPVGGLRTRVTLAPGRTLSTR